MEKGNISAAYCEIHRHTRIGERFSRRRNPSLRPPIARNCTDLSAIGCRNEESAIDQAILHPSGFSLTGADNLPERQLGFFTP
jgi:hypothetical protein